LEAVTVVRDTPDGPELHLTLTWPGGLLDEDDVRRLGDAWARMLTGIATHTADPAAGGHTPSDFPLVRLTQQAVDELQAAVPGCEDVWPLSPLQEGLLFHAAFDGEGPDVYTGQRVLDLG